MNTLYFTGAGVSQESGIPTFRGNDGYWVVNSENYTPQDMATFSMYITNPVAQLAWYYHRYQAYKTCQPNKAHYWLADKNLITQNVDGLDALAGNKNYIPIHGRIDKVMHSDTLALSSEEKPAFKTFAAPWEQIDEKNLEASILTLFNIDPETKSPTAESLRPWVLLFDEYYDEKFQFSKVQERINHADKIVFIGTSFSVGITEIALQMAKDKNIPIEIVDPKPSKIDYEHVTYYEMSACDYVEMQQAKEAPAQG